MITSLLIILMRLYVTGCSKNENELVLVTEAGFAPYEYYEDGKMTVVNKTTTTKSWKKILQVKSTEDSNLTSDYEQLLSKLEGKNYDWSGVQRMILEVARNAGVIQWEN